MKLRYRALVPLLVTLVGCESPTQRPTPEPPGPDEPLTVESQDGLAVVTFPASFFASRQTIQVARSQDDGAMAAFTEFEGLFEVHDKTNYQIRVLSDTTAPIGETFRVTLTVPQDIISPGEKPTLFARVYEVGGEEVLDNFQVFGSTWDPTARTITAELPHWALTNRRRSDRRYEALFMIGTIPTAGPVAPAPRVRALASATCGASPIGSPLAIPLHVTSPYGERPRPTAGMHWGTDFSAPTGTDVLAAADGIVEDIRINSGGITVGYGRYLILRHNDGGATLYAHLDNTNASFIGKRVWRGEKIAESDNTGESTGPHLHFEYVARGPIIQEPSRIDPAACIQQSPPGGTSTVLIDFDDLPEEGYPGTQYQARGVVFSTSWNNEPFSSSIAIEDASSMAAYFSGMSVPNILGGGGWNPGPGGGLPCDRLVRADFVTPQTGASASVARVQILAFAIVLDGRPHTFRMRAFARDGTVLATDQFSTTDSLLRAPAVRQLVVSASSIAYVILGPDPLSAGCVAYDNFSFSW